MTDKPSNLFACPELDGLFEGLRAEFLSQIAIFLLEGFDRDMLVRGFNTHLSRYQQIFLLLGDSNLHDLSESEPYLASALIPKGYSTGDKAILIIQAEDGIMVQLGQPPIQVDYSSSEDVVTLALVSIPEGADIPFSGRTSVITTTQKKTELALVTYKGDQRVTQIMWGDYVLKITRSLQGTSTLN